MTREELKVHCEKQIEMCENWAKYRGEELRGNKIYEEHKLILELLEQEPFMNKPCIAHQVCHENKIKVLDKIKSQILDEAEYAYADFDRYKEDILHAEPDELPDDDFRYGLQRAIEIINKHIRR